MKEVINRFKVVFVSIKTAVCILGLACFVFASSADASNGGNYNKRTFQTANLLSFATGGNALGSIKLWRTKWNLRAEISSADLDPATAYTVWWIVFQEPGSCATTPCGGADLGNPATQAQVFYAGGFLTDNDGVANVTMETNTGTLPEGVEALTGPDTKVRRSKAFSSEIQFVVRSHGTPVAGTLDKQLSTFVSSPGCCVDQQFTFFPPVN